MAEMRGILPFESVGGNEHSKGRSIALRLHLASLRENLASTPLGAAKAIHVACFAPSTDVIFGAEGGAGVAPQCESPNV
ncbi:MAG: hypothetical protein E5W82_32555 [Mesorhizobium sp.]|nr:MAG: hypothetical protein E5W82_32555 [Mesorhizobium sp.]